MQNELQELEREVCMQICVSLYSIFLYVWM